MPLRRRRTHQPRFCRGRVVTVSALVLTACALVILSYSHGLLESRQDAKKQPEAREGQKADWRTKDFSTSGISNRAGSAQEDQVTAKGIELVDVNAARHKLREKSASTFLHAQDKPLIVYVLLESEEQANTDNFQYYLREGIREDDGCSHVILVDPSRDIKSLPRLGTENAKYVKQRSRPCLWAGLGGYLKSEIDMSSFTHVIVLNSALRGPFLPVYSQGFGITWARVFTSRINEGIKLVGPVINCQTIAWPESVPEDQRLENTPHLSHNIFATDKVGLDLLLEDSRIFRCYGDDPLASERTSSVFAASTVLHKGYNLDCLMLRYNGVQWTQGENWGCNAGLEPDEGEFYYDGISVHALEVMFVAVADMMLRKGFTMAKAAKKYDKWKAGQAGVNEDVKTSMYAFDPLLFRAPMIAYMERRGPGCFDFDFYMSHNPEMKGWSTEELWGHFVQSGQFEQRVYRFNCVDILGRSHNCFDTEYYNRANEDLNQLRLEGRPLLPREAWSHFLSVGFFESRRYRFMDICSEDLDSPNNLGEGL